MDEKRKDKDKSSSIYQVERQGSYCVCAEVQTADEFGRKSQTIREIVRQLC